MQIRVPGREKVVEGIFLELKKSMNMWIVRAFTK